MKLPALSQSKKLTLITWVYWILLCYIVAALIWWYIELVQQNNEMFDYKRELLTRAGTISKETLAFIEKEKHINQMQYIGEGLTFLALMVLGAVFVYRAVRKEIKINFQQQNFMMAITHELKTPIAITQLNLETLQKRKLTEIQLQKLISNTLEENGRLNTLCDNILLASRIDAGKYQTKYEKISISELIDNTVQYLQTRFPKRTILFQIEKDLMVSADAFLLPLLFNNLIENAIKYSPSDKPVTVLLQQINRVIRFSVIDEGTGIATAEKLKIFNKFYRTGNESHRKTKGTGLGLYLSAKIAEDHNTTIKISDNLPNGSIFTIDFIAI
jgi:signal transduction histidine kinase